MRRILSMVLVLLVVLGANVYGQQVFFDVDFDDEPLGTMMVIEGVRGIKHDAQEIVETPGRPGKSVYLRGVPNGYGDDFYYELAEPVKDQLTVEAWLLPTGTVRSAALSVSDVHNIGDGDAVSLYIHNNGIIRYFANGAWHEVATYIPGEWVQIKVVIDVPNKTYDIYVDDMEHKVATAPFRNQNRTEMLRVGFYMYGVGTEPSPIYIDSFKVYR